MVDAATVERIAQGHQDVRSRVSDGEGPSVGRKACRTMRNPFVTNRWMPMP